MNIDFEEDESPRQPEQSRPVKPAAPKQAPPVQVHACMLHPRLGQSERPILNQRCVDCSLTCNPVLQLTELLSLLGK